MIPTHLAQRFSVVIWLVALLIVLEPSACSVAQILGDCNSRLKEAQEKFKSGDVNGPIALVEECLKTGDLDREKRVVAYELLGQCYLAKKYIEQARGAISNLLDLLPNYKPDAEQFAPTFVELVEKVRLENKPVEEAGFPTTWVVVGGATVVAVVVYLLTRPDDPPLLTPLPEPPGRPAH
jgi:hypothetical protein